MLRSAIGVLVGLGLAGCGLPAEPLERAGVFKAMDDAMEDLLPEPEQNPAMQELPELGDPQLQTAQKRLVSLRADFTAARERLLSTAGALDCPLAEDLRWRLSKDMTEVEFARTYASMPAGSAPQPIAVEAVLLEGDCRNGRPEGDFVAIGTFQAVQQAGGYTIDMMERRRIEGTMIDGELEGELLTAGHLENVSPTQGPVTSYEIFGLDNYRNGERQGSSLLMSYGIAADGTRAPLTTVVKRVIGPDTYRMIGYSGSVFSSEATYVDGVPHGWMRIHNVQYVKDFESEQPAVQQICYRHGRKAPDSACAAGS